MKTILNLSIVLMLIFGSAGAVNFYKMYKTGEIETLYSHEQPTMAHASAPSPAGHVCKPTPPPPPLPLFDRIEQNIRTVDLDADDFSRAVIDEAPELVETDVPIDTAPVVETMEAAVAQPAPHVVETAVSRTAETEVRMAEANAAPDQQQEQETAKPERKIKFKASMFSRAALVEEPIELEMDSVVTSSVDSLSK